MTDQEKFAQALFLRRLLPVWDQLPEGQKETYRQAASKHLDATAHLTSSPANAARLADSIRSLEDKPSRLIPNWLDVLKKAHSVKLALLAPLALEGIWYVLSSAPPEMRAFVSLPIYFAFAALAIVARIWNQNK